MQTERASSINTKSIQSLIYENPEQVIKGFNIIERDYILRDDLLHDRTQPEVREWNMKVISRFMEYAKNLSPEMTESLFEALGIYNPSFQMRYGVHKSLFLETLRHQGSQELYDTYAPLTEDMRIIGCFAMTELGHSSFLRGLETTATYEKDTGRFCINSPSTTSTKWWIGGSGESATHTVALCQLVIEGEQKGIFWFLVPLRDPESGKPYPGIRIGQLGEKTGRHGVDNGWIQFSQVYIPRENMLMKWAQVLPDGEFVPPPHSAISYATLVGERIFIMRMVYEIVSIGLVIASRYGVVREQGSNDEQIIDYQSYQYSLTSMYSNLFSSIFVYQNSQRIMEENFEFLNDTGNVPAYLMKTQELHAYSSLLKSWISWWGMDSMENIRRLLGGHGYSRYNNIDTLTGDLGVCTTGGGDNYVLIQQAMKIYLNTLRSAESGNYVSESLQFLTNFDSLRSKFPVRKSSDLRDVNILLDAFRWLTISQLSKFQKTIDQSANQYNSAEKAWNENLVEMIQVSRSSFVFQSLECYRDVVEDIQDPSSRNLMTKLMLLFALSHMNDLSQYFLYFNYVTTDQVDMVLAESLQLSREIRPELIPLGDSFGYPDFLIRAPIGKYDGDIYETYLTRIQQQPGYQQVAPYWDEIIKPLVTRPKL